MKKVEKIIMAVVLIICISVCIWTWYSARVSFKLYQSSQEALETYSALGRGVRVCSETIVGSEDSLVEEIKKKCPLEKSIEYPLESENLRVDRYISSSYPTYYNVTVNKGMYKIPYGFTEEQFEELYQLLKSKYE